MTLTADQKREIAQLMFVARHYLRLSSLAAKYPTIKLGSTKNEFNRSGALVGLPRQLTIISAHLASAATRLASVDDILEKAGFSRSPAYSECRAYFSHQAPGPTDSRGSTCSEWFHIMLRDAIGHGEPELSPKADQKKRYRARQNCLEKATFAEAYSSLREIAGALQKSLKRRHGLVGRQ